MLSDAQRVVDAVVCSLSESCPACVVVGIIYESHPALAIGVSATCQAGRQGDSPGLHSAFAISPTLFDRWAVQRDQRNRWQYFCYADMDASALSAYWRPKYLHCWRIVLCEGARPLAYIGVTLEGEHLLPAAAAHALKLRYRQLSAPLRLAALDYQSRRKAAVENLNRDEGAIVLAPDGEVLSASPLARRWLKRDARLRAWLGDASRLRDRAERLEHMSLCSTPIEVSGHTLDLVRMQPTAPPPPARLRASTIAALTPREAELCEWLAVGLTNAAIAKRMGVAPSTVKTMLERLYWKRDVSGRVALLRGLLSSSL